MTAKKEIEGGGDRQKDTKTEREGGGRERG